MTACGSTPNDLTSAERDLRQNQSLGLAFEFALGPAPDQVRRQL